MALSPGHRRFLLIDQCAIPAFINLIANGGISWIANHSAKSISIWGSPGVAPDLILTGFLLPVIICLITSAQIKGKVRSGQLAAVPLSRLPLLKWFQRPAWVRALMLGISGVVLAAGPVVLALTLAQAESFPFWSLVLFKGLWSMLLAAVVCPLIAWWALANASLQAARTVQAQPAPASIR